MTRIGALLACLCLGAGCASAPQKLDPKSPWARFRAGSVFVQSKETSHRKPLAPFEGRAMIRIEVLEVLPEHVRVRVSSRGGGPPKTEEQTLPHAPRVSLEPPELDEQTTIKVPAGTFPCRHRRWTVKSARAAWTVELWDDPAFPLPYRQYVQGPRTTDLRLISVTAPH